MDVKEELHQLIDRVPEADLPIASRFLHFLADGDDPPLTDADWAAVHEGKAEFARGEFVAFDDLKIELDL